MMGQWFHFEDHRLDDAVRWLRDLGVTHLRTGLSWADSFRPDALKWFDRQMRALEPFAVTLTFCFTPEHRGAAAGGIRRILCRDAAPLRRAAARTAATGEVTAGIGAARVSSPLPGWSNHLTCHGPGGTCLNDQLQMCFGADRQSIRRPVGLWKRAHARAPFTDRPLRTTPVGSRHPRS